MIATFIALAICGAFYLGREVGAHYWRSKWREAYNAAVEQQEMNCWLLEDGWRNEERHVAEMRRREEFSRN